MKRAKRIPFSARHKKRLCFTLINHSSVSVPSTRHFSRWIFTALQAGGRTAEISLMLCDEETARNHNRDFRGKDYATNVLSFVLNDATDAPYHTVCGDLLICPQVVAQEAAQHGKALLAHYAHLVVHGTLHLIGFDHESEKEAQTMETLEIDVLNRLGYNNPYL